MPTYEYRCTHCAGEWEIEQKITEPRMTGCPHCKHETAERIISGGTRFSLVGGGWAADNYGSTKPR